MYLSVIKTLFAIVTISMCTSVSMTVGVLEFGEYPRAVRRNGQ